jgi:hypothetical protein
MAQTVSPNVHVSTTNDLPLIKWEQQSWDKISSFATQNKWSLIINKILLLIVSSAGVIVIGIGINLIKDITDPLYLFLICLTCLFLGVILLLSRGLWRDQLGQIQKVSSQQTLVQITYLGFIAKLSIMHSQLLKSQTGNIMSEAELTSFEEYLNRAITQASQQLRDHPIDE